MRRPGTARASSVVGTSSLSALAVERLITSSNLVGSWIGRSAGFSPPGVGLSPWKRRLVHHSILGPLDFRNGSKAAYLSIGRMSASTGSGHAVLGGIGEMAE